MRWLTWLVVLAALALTSVSALAFDKQKAAAKMAEQALGAYESGDYDRAAELYANAFHTDPNPDYLYAQARAEQVGGKTDLAMGHLEDFVANPQAAPDRVVKAKELLDGLRLARLDKRVTEGEAAAKAGDNKLAAQIWLDVVQQAPKRVDLYYRAGVSLQQAGDLHGAMAAFDAYLQKSAADAPERSQAKLRREGLAEKLRPPPAKPPEQPKIAEQPKTTPNPPQGTSKPPETHESTVAVGTPVGVVKQPSESSSPTAGYVLAGTGVALGIGAVVLYALTQSDIKAFNAATAPDASGKIVGIDQQTANSQHASIQTREISAIAMGGAGIALAGVGTWLILRTPESKVTWAPGPALAGAGLAWRF